MCALFKLQSQSQPAGLGKRCYQLATAVRPAATGAGIPATNRCPPHRPPPLSNDNTKNFLLSSQGDDVNEDNTESTHFMFEDPIPRKRKVKMGDVT